MTSSNTVAIDISDSGILISNGNNILIDSPSCALINSDNSIILGHAALEQAHLRPHEISNNYWTQLSSKSNTKYSINNAEIAYRHLAFAWQQVNLINTDAILIVPNTFSKQDLGLLLGICNNLSIPVFALLSNAVLALRKRVSNCKIIYLDIMQQNIVLNEIDHDEKTVAVKQVKKTLPYGKEKLVANIANNIAKIFIHKTRFDPMHSADDEQRFFDALPQWLSQFENRSVVECTFESNSLQYKVNLSKEDIADANQLAFNEIALSLTALLPSSINNTLIICSPNSKSVFSLIDFLNALPGCAVELLAKNSLAEQALMLKNTQLSRQNKVHYTTSIDWHTTSSFDKISFNKKSLRHLDDIPTHILFNDYAYSLAGDTFINKISNTSEASVSNTRGKKVICKITNSGYLKEITKLNATKIKLNNNYIEKNSYISIGDKLSIENNISEFRFIKVNKYET